MNESVVKWQSIVRAILTAVGSFLIGKSIFGIEVSNDTIEQVIGIALVLVSVAWAIKEKTATVEVLETSIRQILTFAGGFLVASGLVKEENWLAIFGAISVILPLLLSFASGYKIKQIEEGQVSTSELQGSNKRTK